MEILITPAIHPIHPKRPRCKQQKHHPNHTPLHGDKPASGGRKVVPCKAWSQWGSQGWSKLNCTGCGMEAQPHWCWQQLALWWGQLLIFRKWHLLCCWKVGSVKVTDEAVQNDKIKRPWDMQCKSAWSTQDLKYRCNGSPPPPTPSCLIG